jgi:hypothetical protein
VSDFSGYAVLTEFTPAITRCKQPPPEIVRQLDWESVSATVEGALNHAKEWHTLSDAGELSIVLVTVTVEPVASVVWPEQPEEREVAVVRDQERLLFP